MLAFVLSGAGNRGPLEVGALRALFEEGLTPDFMVGTSAGALNASYIAAHGATVEATEALADIWREVDARDVYPEHLFQIAWRVTSKEPSLFSNKGMRKLITEAMPPGVETFDDLQIPLYVTATDLISSRLFLFGDDKSAPLVDAVLASASVPAIHPPVEYANLQLVDGGVVANVAASVAMDKGADVIYAINASYGGGTFPPAKGVLEVVGRSINTMVAQSLLQDIERAKADHEVDLYHLHVEAFQSLSFRDFSKTEEMLEVGYQKAKAWLAAPTPPFDVQPSATPAPAGEQVDAAMEYTPPYLR